MSTKSALLVGASGLVGGELLTQLLHSDSYQKVTLFVRKPLPQSHPKLEQVVVDFDNLPTYSEHIHVSDLFCCLGTTIKTAKTKEAFRKVDYEYPLELARLAKTHGVEKYLIISSIGANAKSSFFYNQVKGQIESDLRTLDLPSLHIFRPSILLGDRKEFRLGEQFGTVMSKSLTPLLPRKYRPIHGRTVAAAMLQTALAGPGGVHIYESDRIATLGAARP
ncbi:oxidoreductase [Tumebacillus algifaecis]|uniref:Oxidoreductase n=1 Tax=Tumebacillus algifaecis TaxID=1214604 RepID=A0A223CZM5_9BACL|nr:oxidoreductase [Tumebacillus algifaecis]ASS74792.1 oxidoreductase [Tumebacillus algifaecis]